MKKLKVMAVMLAISMATAHVGDGQDIGNSYMCAVSQFPPGGRIKAQCSKALNQEYDTPCGGTCSQYVANADQITSSCQVCVASSFSFFTCYEYPTSPAGSIKVTSYYGNCGNLTGSGYADDGTPLGSCNPCQNISTTGSSGTETCYAVTAGSSSCLTSSGTWNPNSDQSK